MWVRPLRPVHSVGFHLHPTQALSSIHLLLHSSCPICRHCVTRSLPLSASARASRMTDCPVGTGGNVDDLNPDIRVVGIAENTRPVSTRRNMPGVEGCNLANFSTS